MSVITFDVYKVTLKKHDGFIPSNTEKNYTKLLFRFKENDDWSKCNIITASFFISAEDIVKSDAELMEDDLTATFSIPEEFTGEKGELNLSLQSSYTDENGKSVTLATNIVTLNRNNGIMVKEGANALLYEKIILLIQEFFNNDKELIVDFIDEVNEALSRLYTNNEIDIRLSGKLDNVKGSVSTGNIADDAVTSAKIASKSVNTVHLADDAVGTFQISDGAVTTDKIEYGAVGEDELNSELVEKINSKLSDLDNVVQTKHIADKAVTNDKIANSAITGMKIASGAVSGSKIAQYQINTSHIIDGNITLDKLSDEVKEAIASGGSGGTTNYNFLSNRPTLNGVTIEGNLTNDDLGIKNGEDYILTESDKAEIAEIIKTDYDAELLEILGGDEDVAE